MQQIVVRERNLQIIASSVYQLLKEQGLGHKEVISLLALLAGTVTKELKEL